MSGAHKTTWTDASIETLRRGAAAGETSGQVARTLKMTRNAVQAKAARLDIHFGAGGPGSAMNQPVQRGKVIKGTAWTTQDVQLLRQLASEGKTAREAAPIVGKTPHAILAKASTLQIKFGGGAAKNGVIQNRAAPSAAPQAMPKLREVPSQGPVVRLLDARLGQCRHISGDTDGGDTEFCGAPVVTNSSWCSAHRKVYVHEPTKKPSDGVGRIRRIA